MTLFTVKAACSQFPFGTETFLVEAESTRHAIRKVIAKHPRFEDYERYLLSAEVEVPL